MYVFSQTSGSITESDNTKIAFAKCRLAPRTESFIVKCSQCDIFFSWKTAIMYAARC